MGTCFTREAILSSRSFFYPPRDLHRLQVINAIGIVVDSVPLVGPPLNTTKDVTVGLLLTALASSNDALRKKNKKELSEKTKPWMCGLPLKEKVSSFLKTNN